jgi:hypothetical protein
MSFYNNHDETAKSLTLVLTFAPITVRVGLSDG